MRGPLLSRIGDTELSLSGYVGDYLRGVTERWVKVAPDSNLGILDMFRDRDRLPLRKMVPWAGEFAGKYLTGAVQVYRVTGDRSLYEYLENFVGDLIELQADDGYLGPWPEKYRITNRAPNNLPEGDGTWDTWGHYHVMLGLLLWNEETGSIPALESACKIGDLICLRYLDSPGPRLVETGSTEMNLAPVHSLTILFRRTGDEKYLRMANQIVGEFAARGPDGKPLAGDYLNAALDGIEFYKTPRPRWESLHPVMGLAELYYATGKMEYREAFEQIWNSIMSLDIHNNGGFSSGERAQGNPYHQGAIETCCTIAWTAMTVEMLRLTGNPLAADLLELATLNSVIGMHSRTGRWVTYDTPMDGVRKASTHSIAFQAREGTPELNCCSVNGHRGLGLIGEWAIMGKEGCDGLAMNWYGPCKMVVGMPGGTGIELVQETDYPRTGDIKIQVSPKKPIDFTLDLRIPRWSQETMVDVCGEQVQNPEPGSYLGIDRIWRRGDRIGLSLDMSLHYWVGERECRGLTSIFRGPLLLTYDSRYNDTGPDDLPELDAETTQGTHSGWRGRLPPFLLLNFTSRDGRDIGLCDFGSAGVGGSTYRSWLRVANIEDTRRVWGRG